MSEYHHTLIASVGGQPQIVTLTLDLLLRQGFPVSEVVVLHPAPTNARLQHTLRCLRAEFAHHRYTYDGKTITCELRFETLGHDGELLPDITNTQAARAVRDSVHRLIRRLKQQQRHIHLSASGGRRVISLMAISAALLHFDSFDRIWHIYTPPETLKLVNEGARMHVPPEAGVELIDVPFVPWGSIYPQLSQEADSAQAAQQAQLDQLDTQEKARCAAVVKQATKAQLNVLRKFSADLTPSQVADALGVSPTTIYSHTRELLDLVRIAWCIPNGKRINFNLLRQKFARYFDGNT